MKEESINKWTNKTDRDPSISTNRKAQREYYFHHRGPVLLIIRQLQFRKFHIEHRLSVFGKSGPFKVEHLSFTCKIYGRFLYRHFGSQRLWGVTCSGWKGWHQINCPLIGLISAWIELTIRLSDASSTVFIQTVNTLASRTMQHLNGQIGTRILLEWIWWDQGSHKSVDLTTANEEETPKKKKKHWWLITDVTPPQKIVPDSKELNPFLHDSKHEEPKYIRTIKAVPCTDRQLANQNDPHPDVSDQQFGTLSLLIGLRCISLHSKTKIIVLQSTNYHS